MNKFSNMLRFKPLLLLLILSGVSLTWFVISDPKNGVGDRGKAQKNSLGNADALGHASQKHFPSGALKADVKNRIVGGSLSGDKSENNPHAHLVRLEAGLLSVALEVKPLRWVLDEISRQSGMMFETGAEISEQLVTDAFRNLPLELGLRRLLGTWDLFFFYGGDEAGPQYVWVYPKGKGAGLRPIPPEQWASTQELEGTFNDTDPEMRTQALQALVERQGKAALDLLLLALDDPDDQVRSGALNAAANSNLEIAPEKLINLVHNDSSPSVRLLALAAISNYLEAPPANLDIMQIANYALTDTDPEIRALAENLIDRLEANTSVPRSTPPPGP